MGVNWYDFTPGTEIDEFSARILGGFLRDHRNDFLAYEHEEGAGKDPHPLRYYDILTEYLDPSE